MKKIVLFILFFCSVTILVADESIKSEILNWLAQKNINPLVAVFIISMIPIFELRGAIPIGIITFSQDPFQVFLVAIAGNMVPIFFILLLFDYATKLLLKLPFTKKILEAIIRRTKTKSALVEKYEEFGLLFFVAIPLPVTGAWTGSLLSYLFGLDFYKSIFFIFLGVVCAGLIVLVFTLMGLIGAILAGLILTILLGIKIYKIRNNQSKNSTL